MCNISFDRAKFLLCQWQSVPSVQGIFRQVVYNCRITSIENAVYTDLPNAVDDEVGFVFPHAGYCDSTRIKVDVPHSRIFMLNCVREDTQCLIDSRIVITSATSEVSDLYGYLRSLGQKVL